MTMFLMSLVLLLALSAVFGGLWYEAYADMIVQPFFRRGNWLVIAIYATLLYLFTRIYGGYRIGYLKRGEVIYSAILSMLLVNSVTYLQISLIGRRFMALWPMGLLTTVDMVLITLWAFAAGSVYHKLFPPHQMLLIYGSGSAESLVYKMNTRIDKYDICEAVDISRGLDEVFQCIERFEAIIICDVKAETRNKILKYCYSRSIRTYLTPKISDMIVRGAETIHLFDTPLLLCRSQGLNFEQRLAKRILDVTLSAIALVLASPLMLITAIAIKAYDKGPVLYKQERITLNGKHFHVLKFRSMVVDAEKDGKSIPATDGDPRITPIGKIIRKIRFDELPQIINILKGDMSIVGPRPERVEHVDRYTDEIPEFSYRLKVKAGLTGYAQVIGKYNTSALDKLKLDLMYIENYSFFLDLKLILMTVKILFVPESTEGFQNRVPKQTQKEVAGELKSEAREGIGASGNGR